MPLTPIRQRIDAVLFDYGLVLTGPADPEAWAAMRRITEADEEPFAAAYWAFRLDYDRGTLSGDAYWIAVGRQLGQALTPAQVDLLIEEDNRLWTQLNQPMVDWALRLQRAGTRTGILSNLGDRMMEGVMGRLPWMHGFDHHTFSHTLGITKPEAAIYHHAAAGLQVEPAHILFVDDRLENIHGAEAAGMQAIQYLEHAAFEAELSRRGLLPLWQTGLEVD